MSVDKPTLTTTLVETMYVRGGRGNPILLGWQKGSVEDKLNFETFGDVFRYLGKERISYRILGKPRTVVRTGRWIRITA